jgi:hypothetical protein
MDAGSPSHAVQAKSTFKRNNVFALLEILMAAYFRATPAARQRMAAAQRKRWAGRHFRRPALVMHGEAPDG